MTKQIFSAFKRDQKQWILFLAGTFIFSVCLWFLPKVSIGIFSYILPIFRDLPLFIFGLFVYLIAQAPQKTSKRAWWFWVFLAVILSCIDTLSFQTMFKWYLSADMENPFLLLGLSIALSFMFGLVIWGALFPCLFSAKRNSTIGDGYLQSFLHKRIVGKGLLFIIVLEIVYNMLFWGVGEFIHLPPLLLSCIFKIFYLIRFLAMGFILYWMNEKINALALEK